MADGRRRRSVLVVAVDDGDTGDMVAATEPDDLDALRRAARLADARDRSAEYRAAGRDDHQLLVAVDHPRRGQRTSLVRHGGGANPAPAAPLLRVFGHVGPLAIAV